MDGAGTGLSYCNVVLLSAVVGSNVERIFLYLTLTVAFRFAIVVLEFRGKEDVKTLE